MIRESKGLVAVVDLLGVVNVAKGTKKKISSKKCRSPLRSVLEFTSRDTNIFPLSGLLLCFCFFFTTIFQYFFKIFFSVKPVFNPVQISKTRKWKTETGLKFRKMENWKAEA